MAGENSATLDSIQNGGILLQSSVDSIREEKGMSVDQYFREVFRC